MSCIRQLIGFTALMTVLVGGIGHTEIVSVPSATLHAIDAEAAHIRSDRCTTTQCKALISIREVMDIIMKSLVTTQGITYPIPANRDQIAARSWRVLLRRSAENRGAICDTAAAIAGRYRREGGDKFVPEALIELAVRMDVKGCFPIVLATLHPQGELREDLGMLCSNWAHGTACPAFAN